MTPTLSTLRKRIYELDAKRTQGEWWHDGFTSDSGSVGYKHASGTHLTLAEVFGSDGGEIDANTCLIATLPDAVHLIREQDRLLKEARAELESLCQEFEKALIPIGLGNHKVDAARAFLRQLEESV